MNFNHENVPGIWDEKKERQMQFYTYSDKEPTDIKAARKFV